MGNLVLLLEIGVLLQVDLLRAGFFEGAVIAAVPCQFRIFEVQGHVAHRIEELAVVTDHQHRPLIAFEPGFQPHQGIQVEVVGRFVKQQQIRRTHQRTCQLQAHSPAAGEAVDRIVQFAALEAQAEDQCLRACLGVVCAGVVQGHIGVRQVFAIAVAFSQLHFLLGSEQGRVAFDHEVGRAASARRHLLHDLRQAPLCWARELTGVFVQAAIEQGEQGRFAGAVATDQPDAFAGVDGDRSIVEQGPGAAAQADAPEGDHADETPVDGPAK